MLCIKTGLGIFLMQFSNMLKPKALRLLQTLLVMGLVVAYMKILKFPILGRAGTGVQLRKGLAICIEPMVNTKSAGIRMAKDGWTALAEDNLPSAHFEHTLLVDEGTPEIITLPPGYDNATKFLLSKIEQFSLDIDLNH